MPEHKKINVFSFAKFQAILISLVGLVVGIIYSFGGLFIDVLVSVNLITSTETPGLSYGTVLAFGALIGMPVIFGLAGFVLGIIEALIFNFSAKFFDGIDVDFKQ